MWYIIVGVICIILVLVLIWWFYPRTNTAKTISDEHQLSQDLIASQNTAQTTEDQA
jgi:hypothetical protein